MLRPEAKLEENEGVLITDPVRGLGFHVASALQRLGRRMIGLSPSEVPMQVFADLGSVTAPFSAALFTPEPYLTHDQEIPADDLGRLDETLAKLAEKSVHSVAVWPWAAAAHVPRLKKLGVTVLLSPALFGFRDEGLVDEALDRLARNPALLKSDDPSLLSLLYAGDAAAFAVSALGRPELRGQTLVLPSLKVSRQEFSEAFREVFAVDTGGLWQNFRARLGGSTAWAPGVLDSLEPRGYEPALSHFPTTVTPLGRALKQMAEHHRRSPEQRMLFPPSRAL